MPTREDLLDVSLSKTQELLRSILHDVHRKDVYFTIQQLYELAAVIISIKQNQIKVKDTVCKMIINGWLTLLTSRNVLSHNLYNKNKVLTMLNELYNSTVLLDVCREALDDETLAYPVYYLIGHVLKTGELF